MTITKNRVVSIDYTLTDSKKNIIDSTAGQAPLDYLHGFGNIIPGLEKELEGKSRGDHFSVNIPAAEAYGERDSRLIAEIPLDKFSGVERDHIKAGQRFYAQNAEETRMVTITKVVDNTVTIDGNHPLAGMNLNFDVTVAAIREASEDELLHGHIHGHDHCGCGGGENCGAGHEGCGCGNCGG
jgi:FKBP-type peptidyl-prolyl cis-trans isomerase SlyD